MAKFDHFKSQAGLPGFVMSMSEWTEKTDAIGIIVKKDREISLFHKYSKMVMFLLGSL